MDLSGVSGEITAHLQPTGIQAAYILATVTFVLGLKGLTHPQTARLGNAGAAAGMLIAVVATFWDSRIGTPGVIAGGVIVGGIAGVAGARLAPMTAMPQMVALFNGAGGGAAALVGTLEYLRDAHAGHTPTGSLALSILLGLIIGGVSFSGSLVAFGKLQGIIPPRAFSYPGQRPVTILLLASMLALSAVLCFGGGGAAGLSAVAVLALVFGVALVMPIGGADMPVVISLLNAYTGLAVAAAGFVLGNQLLIVAGTLVGASGTILTRLMSKAMNRSLGNVLFGAFGAVDATKGGKAADDRVVKSATPQDVAILLDGAQSVILVPGYGLAVAQAHHTLRELASQLEKKGTVVKYAIHPVAGRMPGHMNVLLAEANVPYDQLFDMEQINADFEQCDVAVVAGANDVVNPAARSDPKSPIYGMPILDVDKARSILVLKRSMAAGFAGIENELFYDGKTMMVFGDAKDTLGKIVAEMKGGAKL